MCLVCASRACSLVGLLVLSSGSSACSDTAARRSPTAGSPADVASGHADGSAAASGTSDTAGGIGAGGTGAGASNGGAAAGSTQTWELPPHATLASCVPASWTVKASSSAQSNPPEYALDDVGSTRWSSGTEQGAGTFYEIDFGGWVTLDRLVLDNSTGSATDYPRGYELRASKDGVDFERIVAMNWLDFAPTDGVLTVAFEPVPLQALQIATTEHSLNWWSIHELKVGCKGRDDGAPPVDPLACSPDTFDGAGGAGAAPDFGEGGAGGAVVNPLERASWTATASDTAAGDSPQRAIDGSIATRWSSGKGQVGSEWFQLDLGAVGCISSVFLVSGGGDAAIGFTIEVSVDGVSYQQVAKGAGSPVDHIQFKAHQARYVRINQRGAGGANWWSIQEIEVS